MVTLCKDTHSWQMVWWTELPCHLHSRAMVLLLQATCGSQQARLHSVLTPCDASPAAIVAHNHARLSASHLCRAYAILAVLIRVT